MLQRQPSDRDAAVMEGKAAATTLEAELQQRCRAAEARAETAEKAQGETHVLIYMIFVAAVYGLILLVLNSLGLMYSPVSCYVPSDRVHELIAI